MDKIALLLLAALYSRERFTGKGHRKNRDALQLNIKQLMFQARISTWVVLVILAPSVYVTINLLGTYLEAVFGRQPAQWQFEFFYTPIPIMLGLFAFVVAYLCKANRVLTGVCIGVSTLPCLLYVLVKLHAF